MQETRIGDFASAEKKEWWLLLSISSLGRGLQVMDWGWRPYVFRSVHRECGLRGMAVGARLVR